MLRRYGDDDPRDHNYVFEQVVMLTYFDDDARWHCVFVISPHGQQSEMVYRDTRDDAIAWAKERCPRVRAQIPGTSEWEYV